MKDILGYEGLYAITRDGKVWSYPRTNRFNHKIGGKWLILRSGGYGKRDYQKVCLSKNGKEEYAFVHRVVASTYIHNPLKLPIVNHLNFDCSDNRVVNLEWCTQQKNVEHAAKGGRCQRSQLGEQDVKEIRFNYSKSGVTLQSLSKKYNVSKQSIWLIVKRKNWAWLK